MHHARVSRGRGRCGGPGVAAAVRPAARGRAARHRAAARLRDAARDLHPDGGALTERADVVIPGLWNVPGWWAFDRVRRLPRDARSTTPASAGSACIAHSFGGAVLLGFAARRPDRVVECVFGDTLGVNREMCWPVEAAHPFGILRMATPAAASAFVRSWMTRPRPLATAALSAFVDDREADIETVVSARDAVPRAVGRHRHRLVTRRRPQVRGPAPRGLHRRRADRPATARSTTTGCSTTRSCSPTTCASWGCTPSADDPRPPASGDASRGAVRSGRAASEPLEALLPVVVAGLGVEDER